MKKTMKKCLLAVTAGVMVVGGVSMHAHAASKVRWKMQSAYPGALIQLGASGKFFKNELKKISNGTFNVKYFEPKALVPTFEIFEAVGKGSIDAGWASSGFWAGKIPAASFFAAVPFGPGAGEYMAWIDYGGGKELWDEMYKPYNVKGIACGIVAPEAGGWFRKEINTVEDMKGLKMRIFGLGAQVLEKMGASTQLLAPGDIFPALERGTLDATEFSQPAIDLKLGFAQVAKYYYFPGWHQQTTFLELLVNLDKWNALTDNQRAQVNTICRANIQATLAEGEAIQFDAIKKLKSQGVQVKRWSKNILDKFEAGWKEVVAEESAKDKDFKRVWESLQAFRANYKIWKELAYLK